MCLTAGVTPQILADILKVLAVEKDEVKMVSSLPVRKHFCTIIITIIHFALHILIVFIWRVCAHLKSGKQKAKKILIYCR